MECLCHLDPRGLLRIAFGGSILPRADAQRLVREQLAGFSRLYLFTWLERPAEQDCPDVSVADLWIEGMGRRMDLPLTSDEVQP